MDKYLLDYTEDRYLLEDNADNLPSSFTNKVLTSIKYSISYFEYCYLLLNQRLFYPYSLRKVEAQILQHWISQIQLLCKKADQLNIQ